ncbi:tRNA glutamyl-Q(34) synthetase GluQRS [Bythopirellula polymerisocia]|uniref:Glutamate--tRNA ligase n=1 Tax=Bythopirellula polymerisocia TaxID=2528003 RepID=A0A5C6D0N7_9BACT|nr:tRNA glutamyl-Q(34) synthetase GluQRS [Bythopirellula polymerisocia]TWU30278.1 Glutamate--tRNA ligase [Bythopirellula polymerisocia]
MSSPQFRSRLAPSPTGALHLGNARTFLVNWALARQRGWQIMLRIEDLDGPRVKPGAAEESIEILQWLGLDWDEGPTYQLADLTPYQAALYQLASQGDIYSCTCTRKEIEAASLSAPHGDEHELRYPGTCRPSQPVPLAAEQLLNKGTALRLRVPQGVVKFVDQFAGEQSLDVDESVGDFLVATKLGLPGYQLAVVVDDARQAIDQVVRSDDLLSSTPRQMILYEKLGLGPLPQYTHLPLVVGEDGRRLAKRHGDSRLSYFRELGVPPDRIIGLLAEWCGLSDRQPMTAKGFLQLFELQCLPFEQVVYTSSDEAWLLGND